MSGMTEKWAITVWGVFTLVVLVRFLWLARKWDR